MRHIGRGRSGRARPSFRRLLDLRRRDGGEAHLSGLARARCRGRQSGSRGCRKCYGAPRRRSGIQSDRAPNAGGSARPSRGGGGDVVPRRAKDIPFRSATVHPAGDRLRRARRCRRRCNLVHGISEAGNDPDYCRDVDRRSLHAYARPRRRSEIAPEDEATPIQIAEDTPLRTTVRLSAGAARFRVRHDVRRLFRVDAGSIQVEDLGTVFRVAHEMGGRVRVTVSEGRVAVVGAASRLRVELGAGEDRVFSANAEARGIVEQPFEGAKTAVRPVKGATQGQSRAQGGDDPAGLLAAADVARRSRSPRGAVEPLQRLVERYPRDRARLRPLSRSVGCC